MEVEVQDQSSGPEEDVLGQDALKVVEAFVSERPHREKLFLRLYYDDELPAEEIAKIMDMSTDTLYVFKHRILKKLRSSMESVERI